MVNQIDHRPHTEWPRGFTISRMQRPSKILSTGMYYGAVHLNRPLTKAFNIISVQIGFFNDVTRFPATNFSPVSSLRFLPLRHKRPSREWFRIDGRPRGLREPRNVFRNFPRDSHNFPRPVEGTIKNFLPKVCSADDSTRIVSFRKWRTSRISSRTVSKLSFAKNCQTRKEMIKNTNSWRFSKTKRLWQNLFS